MQPYVTEISFRPTGSVDQLGNWLETLDQTIQQGGGQLIDAYGMTGDTDLMVIAEFENAEQVAKTWLPAVAAGIVKTRTREAIPADVFTKLVKEGPRVSQSVS